VTVIRLCRVTEVSSVSSGFELIFRMAAYLARGLRRLVVLPYIRRSAPALSYSSAAGRLCVCLLLSQTSHTSLYFRWAEREGESKIRLGTMDIIL